MTTEAHIAWAAGIFEGEGCISIKKPAGARHMPSIRMTIQMTDEDVLVKFCEAVGCGTVTFRRAALIGKKAVYSWDVGNRLDVDRLLTQFLPWFGERRASKARLALAECASMDRKCADCGKPFRAYRSDAYWCCHHHKHAWKERQRRAAERFIEAVI